MSVFKKEVQSNGKVQFITNMSVWEIKISTHIKTSCMWQTKEEKEENARERVRASSKDNNLLLSSAVIEQNRDRTRTQFKFRTPQHSVHNSNNSQSTVTLLTTSTGSKVRRRERIEDIVTSHRTTWTGHQLQNAAHGQNLMIQGLPQRHKVCLKTGRQVDRVNLLCNYVQHLTCFSMANCSLTVT